MPVISATTESEIRECWPVMKQLRPHLTESEYMSAVAMQAKDGFRLAFVRHNGKAAAVAGYRLMQMLAWGRFCYVDDLITDENVRSQGLGAELIDWLVEFARREGCARLELDSGVQRFDAHRFYLRQRMSITCHHFSLSLAAKPK